MFQAIIKDNSRIEVAPMIATHQQYLVDENGKPKAVLIPLEEWEAILEEIEELEAIRDYDHAKSQGSDPIPFETAIEEIDKHEISGSY